MSEKVQVKAKTPSVDFSFLPAPVSLLEGKRALAREIGSSRLVSQPALLPAERTTPCPASPRRCPFGGVCHTCPVGLQARLAVSQPGDEYEQEADRVAEMVMHMPEPKERKECLQPGGARSADRQATNTATLDAVPPIVRDVLRSPGQPLDSNTRASLESRLGHDFSGVRVHMDGSATASAQVMEAQAYTLGRDIVFGYGTYNPSSQSGTGLLAHELVHVIQQSFSSGAAGCGQQGVVQRRGQSSPYATQAEVEQQIGRLHESLDDERRARSHIIEYYREQERLIDLTYDSTIMAIMAYDRWTEVKDDPGFDLLDVLDFLGSLFKAVRAFRPILGRLHASLPPIPRIHAPSVALPGEQVWVPKVGFGTVIGRASSPGPLGTETWWDVGMSAAESIRAVEATRKIGGRATTGQEITAQLASKTAKRAHNEKVDALVRCSLEKGYFENTLDAVKKDPQYKGQLYDIFKESVGDLPDPYGEEIEELKDAPEALELFLYKTRFGSGAGPRCVGVRMCTSGLGSGPVMSKKIEGGSWTLALQDHIAELLRLKEKGDQEQISAICDYLRLPARTDSQLCLGGLKR